MSFTGYNVNFVDLIYIFKPYDGTSTPAAPTGYIFSNNTVSNVDLNTIFQPWDGISTQADPTGYTIANGDDLNTIFQNLHNYVVTSYNPFSANTTPTGYIYNIFSVSDTLLLTQTVNNAYIFLIGGGGGGGSGLGYEGGGAGGNVTMSGPVTLAAGSYNITVGNGGLGGPFKSGDFNGANGQTGGTTSMSGTGFTTLSAIGGGGGGGSAKNNTGAGGQNNNTSPNFYGWGGESGVTVTNVQGTKNGNGYNGYPYTFSDGTVIPTTFYFGGGGGAGGRNSTNATPVGTAGGGGVPTFPSYGSPSITFTAQTGGCGGDGSAGISTFLGFDYTFNGNTYNTGSGGGGGGNSSANYYSPGGLGNQGLAIIYYPVPFTITSSNISNITVTSTTQNNYIIYTFITSSEVGSSQYWNPGTCTINFSTNANISVILVGGGGGGGDAKDEFSGGGGGGGVFNLTTANVSVGVNYSLQVGSGGTYYVDGNQDGQSSTLSGGSINLSVNGGNQGVNATTSSNGAGGTSSNGGNGGNGGNPGSSGSNGSYNNYPTVYGSTLNIGGGGGGGSKSSTDSFIGYGYGGSNGTGGAAGNNSSTFPHPGVGFGAAGGGAPGITFSGTGTALGGAGHSGLVIIYIAN